MLLTLQTMRDVRSVPESHKALSTPFVCLPKTCHKPYRCNAIEQGDCMLMSHILSRPQECQIHHLQSAKATLSKVPAIYTSYRTFFPQLQGSN
ncbi:hypothetical protein V6N13_040790 [Hibiscus sabdariffa]